jgi:hypothetical protein
MKGNASYIQSPLPSLNLQNLYGYIGRLASFLYNNTNLTMNYNWLTLTIAVLLFSFNISLGQEKWTKLFNGKDLTGWKPLNGKAKYEVKNGEIIGTTVFKEPNSFMVTEATYGDFILELEYKLDADMNSGI